MAESSFSMDQSFASDDGYAPTDKVDENYRPKLGMVLGLTAGFCHTGAALINTDLTKRIGMKSIVLQVAGALSTFAIFHVLRSIFRNKEEHYWSNYLEDGKFSVCKMLLPLLHSFFVLWALLGIFGQFYFLGLCENPQNAGIISSL